MKKLMIAAATAAMIGSVFADSQVYDMKLSVKTTVCKAGKFTAALEKLGWWGDDIEKGDAVSYRKQASLTIAGVIWGCDCDTIADPQWRTYTPQGKYNKAPVGGYAFWNATPKVAIPLSIPYVSFGWALLNRIDQMKTVEGTWILSDPVQDEALFFLGAGFGTVKNAANDCSSYISSMKGDFAGFIQGGSGEGDECIFCGESFTDCLVAPFCVCADPDDTTAISAAYGSWTLKYNASASKKLKKKYYITDVMSFKSKKLAYVGEALDAAWLSVQDLDEDEDLEADLVGPEGEPTNEDAEIVEIDPEVYYDLLGEEEPELVEEEMIGTLAANLITGAFLEADHDEEE